MRNIEIVDVVQTGLDVQSEHFGGNVVFSRNTLNGVPDPENQIAHSELGITIARYPAGEPDVAYEEGLLINGALPQHLINFLNAARENEQLVVIVTPTHSAYNGAHDLTMFTQLLMREFSDVVHAFEIGNEYWNHQTETSYGQVANDSILAISEGLELATMDVPIWVQMGDAGGQASELSAANGSTSGWLWRNIGANNLIIDQLSFEAREKIDGVVEHYYFREDSQALNGTLNDQNIRLDHGIWESALGRDLTLNITEWNIRTTNLDQLGMRAASTLIAQFSFMMEIEVDEAYVWPPMHNASSDLAGSDYVILDVETGIVVNSVGGAAFDLMSSSLVGLEYLPVAVTEDSSAIDQYVYADDNKVVVYLNSRSNSSEEISFSLGSYWQGAQLSSAIQIGYNQSTSDGRHYDYVQNAFVDSVSVIVNNEEYFVNEHDVQASIEVHDVSQLDTNSSYSVTLLPYEIIELTYSLPDYLLVNGSNGNDLLRGEEGQNELIRAGGGNDNVQSGSGNDTIYGESGDDYIDAGQGSDVLYGGVGNDILRGRAGADELYGSGGADDIQGGSGDDYLEGGLGADILDGGAGNDTIISGLGDDLVLAGAGDDTIELSSHQVHDESLGAFNASNAYQVGTGTFLSISGYSMYSTLIFGGDGYDVLNLSAANDAFFLQDEHSGIYSGFETSMSSRFSNIEEINAGAGNDIIDFTSTGATSQERSLLIDGGSGNDIIWGSTADERIFGGDGEDTLFGGGGENTLIGGGGADVFEFTSSSVNTTVSDFNATAGDLLRVYETSDFQVRGIEMDSSGFNLLFFDNNSIRLNIHDDMITSLTPEVVWESIEIL